MTNPLVSILIPVFNREKLVCDCIQSALCQTFDNFEIVIVDNSSSDGTYELCRWYAEKYQRIRLYRNERNVGPVRNWLRCVEEARGKFGKFLFSDDLMLPTFLENTLPLIENPDCAFVVSNIKLGNTLDSAQSYLPNVGTKIEREEYFRLLSLRKVTFSPSAAIFRLDDIRSNLLISPTTRFRYSFADNGAGPDVLLFGLTALQYKYIATSGKHDIFFRIHAGSLSIGSERGEVQRNYNGALAWFFRRHTSRHVWATHVAFVWLFGNQVQRTLRAIPRLCFELEGKGDASEFFGVVWRIIVVGSLRMVSRAIEYFGASTRLSRVR